MALKMARPMRRKGSTFIQFRRRIPRDMLSKARGLTLAIPVGDDIKCVLIGPKADTVTISLQTRDPREATERQAKALTYWDAFWESVRNGPKSLTHKQIVALAGEVYRETVGRFEEDPGSSEIWEHAVRLHASAMAGKKAERLPEETAAAHQLRSMEQWFGETVDQVLARHQLIIDHQSREKLLVEIGVSLSQAADRLRRNSRGDYRSDDVVERFPAFERPKEATIPHKSPNQTISGLVEGWWREAKAAGKAISTYEAYERVARQFVAFLGHDDAKAVSQEDVIRFKDHRIEQGASTKTVMDTDLSALRKLFGWGLDNRRVRENPALGVKVMRSKKVRTRPKGFTDAEAGAVLSHSLHHQRGREGAKIFAAKRWIPWLCAYTGARVGEIAQLRKQDVRLEDGHWIITIAPEAGTVKDHEYRDVPLHPHLIELGFSDFVNLAQDGYLFLNPSDASEKSVRGAWRNVKNKVTEFVREVVTDRRVQPNHGWRHRFMTTGRELDISRDVRYAITGHSDGDAGADYGDVTIKAKATAITKYPRYRVKSTERSA